MGAGHGDGVHILTGPVYVCGAEPGMARPLALLSFWLEIVKMRTRAMVFCRRHCLGIYQSSTVSEYHFLNLLVLLPGDVLQVEVLELKPRPNPGQGNRTYGSNTAGSWGEVYCISCHFLH